MHRHFPLALLASLLAGPAFADVNAPAPVASNPSSVYSNQFACSTTATALPSLSLVNGASITAWTANTGTIYVGGPNVSTSSKRLGAGMSASFGVTNLANIYYICSNATDTFDVWGN